MIVLWKFLPSVAAILLSGCYSFRGGSVPPHLNSITIPEVEDASGYGDGTVRQDLTTLLVARFRQDNSLSVIDQSSADSRLAVTISTLRDDVPLGVAGTTEFETDRALVIEARVTFTDNVKRRAVYSARQFVGRSQYTIASGLAGKKNAMREALVTLTDDILLATVADW